MPRANRYILPGYIYHLTHRCHNRQFLLRYRLDRVEYVSRLRNAALKHRIALFDFSVTCNHVHLLGMCDHLGDLSRFMQGLEGEFAGFYNSRKNRSGAFWGDRFHCTMVEGGDHLWNCLRYIDLNMVRAGVVCHPGEWQWCGYHEIVGDRERYRMLAVDRLVEQLGLGDRTQLKEIHRQRINEALRSARPIREGIWTESIAVGSEAFVRRVALNIKVRRKLEVAGAEGGAWYVKEDHISYAYTLD